MLRSAPLRPALAAALLALPAVAADLSAMSRHDQRMYCLAYLIVDIETRHENGLIDDATYNRERMQVGSRLQNRGDNYNYEPDIRQIDRAIRAIVAEQPPLEEVSAQAASCRRLLRM